MPFTRGALLLLLAALSSNLDLTGAEDIQFQARYEAVLAHESKVGITTAAFALASTFSYGAIPSLAQQRLRQLARIFKDS